MSQENEEKKENTDHDFADEEVQGAENGKKELSSEDQEKIAHNMRNFKLYKSNPIPERLRN